MPAGAIVLGFDMSKMEPVAQPTRRVQFWVSANVPVGFDEEELAHIAHNISIQASDAFEPGVAVDHGYKVEEKATVEA